MHTRTVTNLDLDADLLDRAFRVSGEPTMTAAVTRALENFIARREQQGFAKLFGKLEWDAACDYKAERSRKQESLGRHQRRYSDVAVPRI